MQIRVDDLTGAEIRALLAEHLCNMNQILPPESVHALDVDGLLQPEITFCTRVLASPTVRRSPATPKIQTASS